ncbi:hypothetical protein CBR_g51112 [Chara braunii]|uniref:LysM domain-containing protein n=1 Tax=Chara braunii TaxID=69332 RepID=A0A388K642_CHABU|nr:hypothetical protein CBR_g51112 [Chara braunii]|eukprot:GBG65517.1 hypothetical protein CBR_g51112 [Chara braunii]
MTGLSSYAPPSDTNYLSSSIISRPTPSYPPDSVLIEEGDTLWDFYERFGVNCKDLQDANNLKDDLILAGDALRIPKVTYRPKAHVDENFPANSSFPLSSSLAPLSSSSSFSSSSSSREHGTKKKKTTKAILIQKGDTAWGISERFGLSLADLKEVNDCIPEVLFPGDVLQVPADAVERPKALIDLKGAKADLKRLAKAGLFPLFFPFPPPRDVEEYRQSHRIFLDALRLVETSNIMPAPKGDDGLSIGPLQIRRKVRSAMKRCGYRLKGMPEFSYTPSENRVYPIFEKHFAFPIPFFESREDSGGDSGAGTAIL